MVFLSLFTIGILLIIYSVLGLKKENKLFNNILQDEKKNMPAINIEIGELRREVGETLTEIQRDIINIEEELNKLKNEKVSRHDEEALKDESYNTFENKLSKKNIEKNFYTEQQELNMCYNKNKIYIKDYKKVKHSEQKENPNDSENIKKESKLNSEEIRKLLEEGKSVDYICENFHIGKGEVLLIKDLYIN